MPFSILSRVPHKFMCTGSAQCIGYTARFPSKRIAEHYPLRLDKAQSKTCLALNYNTWSIKDKIDPASALRTMAATPKDFSSGLWKKPFDHIRRNSESWIMQVTKSALIAVAVFYPSPSLRRTSRPTSSTQYLSFNLSRLQLSV